MKIMNNHRRDIYIVIDNYNKSSFQQSLEQAKKQKQKKKCFDSIKIEYNSLLLNWKIYKIHNLTTKTSKSNLKK
jgi:hypothetical protein